MGCRQDVGRGEWLEDRTELLKREGGLPASLEQGVWRWAGWRGWGSDLKIELGTLLGDGGSGLGFGGEGARRLSVDQEPHGRSGQTVSSGREDEARAAGHEGVQQPKPMPTGSVAGPTL